MNKKLLLTLTAVVAVALPSFAAKKEKTAKKEHPPAGIIKSVSADEHSITISEGKKDNGKKEQTFKVGKDVDLSKLKVGESVRLKVSDANVVESVTPFEKKKKDK